jgi:hypothetical protein
MGRAALAACAASTYTAPDGTATNLSESQVVSMFLEHLLSQVQLSIGLSTSATDLKLFLKAKVPHP